MFKSNTVFVIGAGASAEAGLPVGRTLTQEIATLLDMRSDRGIRVSGDEVIVQTLRNLARQEQWQGTNLFQHGFDLAQAMAIAPSIDTFLQTHHANAPFVKLGKLGIARAIGIAERGSLLAADLVNQRPFDLKRLTGTWYSKLADACVTGSDASAPEQVLSNLTFIVFNYDRCLEIYLMRALAEYFRITPAESLALVEKARIFHPYGSLGSLTAAAPDFVPYGDSELDVEAASNRIKTFSETLEDADMEPMRAALSDAKQIIFLGFAFHEANMDLLNGPTPLAKTNFGQRVLATAFNLSESDAEVHRLRIAQMLRGRSDSELGWIKTYRGTCAEFFDEFAATLRA